MKSLLALALTGLVVALASADAASQSCGTGQTLLKNDILPDIPSGKFRYGVVPGLCKNEAAMSYFKYGTPCNVTTVSVLFGHAQGTNGAKAVVDVEIYDGATFGAGGKVTLGTRLFKLSSGGSNLQIASNGINEFTLPKPVFVPGGNPVIAFRMILNTSSGSCSTGYAANFSVDADGKCTPGKNILDTTNPGWGIFDPAVFRVPPLLFPFCPLYFNGSWVIRACVQPVVSVNWTGNATPGGVISFTFNAPGQSNNGYFLLISGGIANGWKSPWGNLPLDNDFVFNCFLGDCASILVNRVGTINSSGRGFGGMLIPNAPILKNSGFKLYAGFVTFKNPNIFPWVSVSAPSRVITIN